MIIKNINFHDFRQAFKDFERDNFTYEGQQALFDYLEELSESTGKPIELDVIALCCEFTEYNDLIDLKGSYPDIENMDQLAHNTTIIDIPNTSRFIIQNY